MLKVRKVMLFSALILFTLSVSDSHAVDPKPRKRGRVITWVKKEQTHKPGNSNAAKRHEKLTPVKNGTPEYPPYIADGSKFVKQGNIFGPNETYDAGFNTSGWEHKGNEYYLMRAELNNPGGEWKKVSKPVLGERRFGEKEIHFFEPDERPMFDAEEWFEKIGGAEDGRYANLKLQPYIDPKDGKSFDGAIMYTGYDGHNARIAVTFFNHDNPSETRKAGLVFDDADILANPFVTEKLSDGSKKARPWNKSMAFKQYQLKGPDGKLGPVKNVYFYGEGNLDHGGIMVMTSDFPFSSQPDGSFGLKHSRTAKPAIIAREGFYTQGLVEAASQPMISELSAAQKAKTGQNFGITLDLHGDTSPWGYAVGFAVFPLENPETGPIYQSDVPYLYPTKRIGDVQVEKVIFNAGMIETGEKLIKTFGEGDTFTGTAIATRKKTAKNAPYIEYNPCRETLLP